MNRIKPIIHNIAKGFNPSYKIKPLLYCFGLFFISSCQTHQTKVAATSPLQPESVLDTVRKKSVAKKIDSLKTMVLTGDLITRTGNDFTSESLQQLNQRDKRFSHCGIASIENDTVFVYHALGGEFNPDQKIIREPLKKFGFMDGNKSMGLFRYQLTPTEISKLLEIVKMLYRMGVPFDLKFDLESDSRMYCAEFVYKSLLIGTGGRLKFNISHIGKFSFIGVDDLFLQKQCRELYSISYK